MPTRTVHHGCIEQLRALARVAIDAATVDVRRASFDETVAADAAQLGGVHLEWMHGKETDRRKNLEIKQLAIKALK